MKGAIVDPKLSFGTGSTKKRGEKIRGVLLHWTGGVGDEAQFHETLRMRALSIHYYVKWTGEVWQMADDNVQCAHAGYVNPWTIGIEIQSPGYPNARMTEIERARGVVRKESKRDWMGRKNVRAVGFATAQTASVVQLVESLCKEHAIPRVIPKTWQSRQTKEWASTYSGVLGHCHVHDSKDDPGPLIFEALLATGFVAK